MLTHPCGVVGKSRTRRPLPSPSRQRSAALLTGIMMQMMVASAVPALAQLAGAQRTVEAGVVITAEELPVDRNGFFILDGLSGILPQRAAPPEVKNRVSELTALRDQLLATTPVDDVLIVMPPLPGTEKSAPAMDSGDPDPDRLLPSTIPAEIRPDASWLEK